LGGGLDLALLGIGLNGHVGLNEPGSTLESPTRRTAMHPTSIQSSARYFTHSNLPQWGLTVGMKELFAAREVWLMATGSAKAEIVRRLARGPVSPDVPASFFQKHSNCFLLLDAKAAAQL
jgi:glucosamine-6-phosphate deaminase